MATVTVEVNGRPYSVGCADGQEDRVRQLAREFDANVRQIGREVGQVGDLRLFLMAALLVSDELADVRNQLARAKEAGGAAPAAAIERLAERIEKLAEEIA